MLIKIGLKDHWNQINYSFLESLSSAMVPKNKNEILSDVRILSWFENIITKSNIEYDL